MRIPNKIVEINIHNKHDHGWRRDLPLIKSKKQFFDENNNPINPYYYEKYEQYLVHKWIKDDDIVLELGGRYGIVACTVDSILDNKKNHVVVEPDKSVLSALKKNKKRSEAEFYICEKAISNKPLQFIKYGIGSFTENPKTRLSKNDNISIKFKDFMDKYNLNFNVLIADCEGCLYSFMNEIPLKLFKNINIIIFEKDRLNIDHYNEIYKKLIKKNFINVDNILNGFQQVWIKNK